jgi:hypothetical protein
MAAAKTLALIVAGYVLAVVGGSSRRHPRRDGDL